jgi:ABC-2 type transport system ATP-binding protein
MSAVAAASRPRPASADPASAPAGTPALEVAALSHSFGARKVLDEVSFAVPAGGFAVLLGQNGAGKTTLFSLITRLYDHRSGAVRVYGHEVRGQPAAALALMGVVFQQRTLDLDLSVQQNLLYHAALHGIEPARGRRRIAAELARAGFGWPRRGSKVRKLERRADPARRDRPRAAPPAPAAAARRADGRPRRQGARRRSSAMSAGSSTRQGIGVLWATHLFDEVAPGTTRGRLHQGKVLAHGPVEPRRSRRPARRTSHRLHAPDGSQPCREAAHEQHHSRARAASRAST